ncbi:hypothetical protein C2G38_2200819 [Gigaspora rosea]|uniref:Uncharacterized protein n=1 Tax=Gigaspora rosea TaxID=44941 RepID=A0A397UQ78_9GLOM|nr:hypothetical protein C2G38_2200819 [Gigaspora rosea]CAG8792252.1 18848_t:CDS:1 [Gigaspora rosea]
MTEANSNIGPAHQNLQEKDNKIALLIESIKKLGLEKDKSLPNSEASAKAYIIDNTVSDIVKQVSGKKIWISLYRLLAIMKPEIQQDIINSIANLNISRRNHILFKKILRDKARKKIIFNDTISESSSLSESEFDSEWS